LSARVKDAQARLGDMELPVPQADPKALARAQWEKENYRKPGLMSKSMGLMRSGPEVSHAAKSGNPTMTDPKRTLPASIPVAIAEGTATGTTDVSATPVGQSSALDTKPDARTDAGSPAPTTPEAAASPASTAAAPPAGSTQPLPTNRDKELQQLRATQAKKQAKLDKKKKKSTPASKTSDTATPPATAVVPQGTTPPAGQPPAANPQL
jgi:outer membrane protein assembly factor BamD